MATFLEGFGKQNFAAAAKANVTGLNSDGTPRITAGNYPAIARLQAEEDRAAKHGAGRRRPHCSGTNPNTKN